MLNTLKNSIDILKRRVHFNMESIQQNEKKIEEILKEPLSEVSSERLNNYFDFNNKLLQENKDALKLQQNLIRFADKYKDEAEEFSFVIEINGLIAEKKDEIKEITKDDYFDLTINGALDFNEQHPYYDDKTFLNDLLNYFTENENYEMCSNIVSQIRQLNVAE